jgi:hypothetical protein
MFIDVGKALYAEFSDLKTKMGYEPILISDDQAVAIKKMRVKIWIDLVALSIISLSALLVLFENLSKYG